jgi:hypothetical protein
MKTLILGKGYVGSRLADELPNATYTNRKKKYSASIPFELECRTTWKNIRQPENVIWTFPPVPLELVKEFYNECLRDVKNLIILGSTSCYTVKRQKQKISEESELNLQLNRVQGEEFLREQGAMILSLAGIYGPNRSPKSWLYKGLIRNPKKFVNLIHVKDIVFIINHFLSHIIKGQRLNLSDGQAKSWMEIGENCDFHFRMPGERELSKIISNEKLVSLLPKDYKFQELYSSWE